ncbi:MAG: NAD(P)/FAD-dependent oxidoreductase [Hyphomonadaceae bacterium JAD_PAG50586_4]|nr:MAG: NAD(P)/FAD-dependent oxidoreductase [Hyphomonadaceae bacterium JAD_PAG50586_4]
MADFDVAIIGAGAVGLAAGYACAKRGLSVLVLEQAPHIGAGVSSRNSEVIHAGLHYATGSLKARLCVQGRRALYTFLADHNVACDKSGKLIVATEENEIPALQGLARQGEINGVEGVRWLGGEEARALEPQLNAAAALLSEESGVFDAHGYMGALQGEIEAHGGAVVLNSPFDGARAVDGVYVIQVGGQAPTQISTSRLVIAAGLGAQACAAKIDGFPAAHIPALHFGKGNYFALHGVKAPFTRLIYPPPIPGALGTHYRRDLGGVARFGPDLEWVDHEDYKVDPARVASFYATVRRFWPSLPDGALQPDYAGIRPKLHGPGEAQGDFVIDDESAHGQANLVCLFGIESPGLTSSLAIGEEVADRLGA